MALTFSGGVHVDENKNTRKSPIMKIPAPLTVSIPLSQHIGAECVPTVKVGDRVLRGQKIGEVVSGLGCPVHSSVSGTVTEIVKKNTAQGRIIQNIVIKNDFKDELSPDIAPYKGRIADITLDDIIETVKNAGISGMGGATFPTYAKIASAAGKVEHLIINCAECEPYITANHRLLLENPAAVINGLKILIKGFGLRKGIIAVEDNKMDAVVCIDELIRDSSLIDVKVLKTKYPQGDERQLIYAITGRELPPGKLPADVGCVIFNAETCAAIYSAFAYGMPLIERIVTVDGDCISEPHNLVVPLGTSFREVIEFCGGLSKPLYSLISGGPMMGSAQWTLDTPVIKGTSAILALSEEAVPKFNDAAVCIHCGKCVGVCPMHLMPLYLANFSISGRLDMCEDFSITSCVECGSCSYICPGYVPIVQYIRASKGKINAAKIAAKAAAEKKSAVKTEVKTDAKADAKTEKNS